jgi:hypothetical protein
MSYAAFFYRTFIEEILFRNSDYFVPCSAPLCERLLNKGFSSKKIGVIRIGVDTSLFKPLPVSLSEKEFIVTYAGALQNLARYWKFILMQ